MQIRKKVVLASPVTGFERQLDESLSRYCSDIAGILNRGIRVDDNFQGGIFTVSDTGNADTEFEVAHTISRVPNGFIIIYINKAGIVYDSGTPWTSSKIYLKCSQANATLKLLVV